MKSRKAPLLIFLLKLPIYTALPQPDSAKEHFSKLFFDRFVSGPRLLPCAMSQYQIRLVPVVDSPFLWCLGPIPTHTSLSPKFRLIEAIANEKRQIYVPWPRQPKIVRDSIIFEIPLNYISINNKTILIEIWILIISEYIYIYIYIYIYLFGYHSLYLKNIFWNYDFR